MGEEITLAAIESTLANVAHLMNLKLIDKEENFVTFVCFLTHLYASAGAV